MPTGHLQTLEDALQEIQNLRDQLAAQAESTPAQQPIAIIGIGCRFPGGINTPAAFWELLANGGDALGEIPGDRWDIDAYHDPEMGVPGKMYVKTGCYLDEVDKFDPQFFRISPREAESLDPQQRLLLEVSWEALEHAGIAATSLKGSQTGIFVGQYWDDYSMQRIYGTAPTEIDRYAQLSSLRGLSAGRIAHTLDVNGPTMQLDTACSSALLAVQLACQSLRNGDSDLALAGGVSLVLGPEHLIGICQMKALAPDGRCKTFDAKADGFGQGEGCGMVTLKRLSDAQRDGDPILAVIRGTAVNHDGHSRTVTTPNGPAQRAMLQQALDDGGIDPHALGYVEAHGTGTSLGDPIEFLALARVLCQDRDHPLYVGSVKANIGHLDSAAGIAGLLKVVLSLQHDMIPPQPNFDEPNPRIPWDDWPIRVPTKLTPMTQKLAGVSAFGMSGTNVHLILEAAPEPATISAKIKRPQHLLTLSAKDTETLHDLAQLYLTRLMIPGDQFADICFTAATGRTHFKHRLAVIAESAEDAYHELTSYLEQGSSSWLFAHPDKIKRAKIAFLFTGQGAQYLGMGSDLYATQPTFRFWIQRCAHILADYLDKPLLEILYGDENYIDQTAYTQPALFAIEYALAQLWLSWGIEPDVMMGHSVGEYAAACIAGIFTLEEGLKLIAARGRLMQSLPTGGEMVSVLADEATLSAHIAPYSTDVSIAAVNGPTSIVISGQDSALQQVVATLQTEGIKTKQLAVSHAFHSPLMDPILDEFAQIAQEINYSAPTRAIVSNVTGQPATDDQFNADYWVRHLRQAVRFADGINTLQKMKVNTFIEIGPKPTLLGMGRGCLPEEHGAWYPSLRPDAEWSTLLASVAQLHVQGVEIDWHGFDHDYAENLRKVTLPTYPWRRQRYWTDVVTNQQPTANHPLLHQRIASASQQHIFESQLSANQPAYLADHRSFGTVLLPASAYIEMALAAGRHLWGHDQLSITEVSIQQVLILTEDLSTVQLIVTPDQQAYIFELFSMVEDTQQWIRHATGRIEKQDQALNFPTDLATLQTIYSKRITPEALDQRFAEIGMVYGPAFQAPQALYYAEEVTKRAVLAHMQLPAATRSSGQVDQYQLHPVLLDGCFRMSEALFQDAENDQLYLPFGITTLQFLATPQQDIWVYATGTEQEGTRVINLRLFDQDGIQIAAIDGLLLRAASVDALRRHLGAAQRSTDFLTEWLYELTWQPKPIAPNSLQQSGPWLILADKNGKAAKLADLLAEQGQTSLLAFVGPAYQHLAANQYRLDPDEPGHFRRLFADALPESPAGIIHLWSLDQQSDNLQNPISILHLLQALDQTHPTTPLYIVTSGAVLNSSLSTLHSSLSTTLWGLGRVIQQEYPQKPCICIDLEPDSDDLSLLLNELRAADGEDHIAFRNGQRNVARLAHANLTPSQKPVEIVGDATYLITGGLGALGLQMAEQLVAEGAHHLLLTGRRGITTPEQQIALDQLMGKGAQVQVIQADVAKPDHVANVLAQAEKPLRGVIHAAGVVDDGLILQQSRTRFEKVAAPKIQGAWNLHTQTVDQPLDFMIFFSSVASLMGSVGQANYATANAFMDGLAHQRRANGLPALSINWGPWGDVGMAATEQVKRRLAQEGWDTISSEQGWQIIEKLLQHDVAQVGALPMDWTKFVQQVPDAMNWSILKDLTAQLEPVRQRSAPKPNAIKGKLQTALPEEQPALLVAYLQERAAQALRIPVAQLDEQQSLTHLGIDSLIAVEMRSWVRNDLDIDLPLERFLTAPTISDLAAEIHRLLTPADSSQLVAESITTWVTCPQPRPEAKLRLFCFHYAGGGASVYREWLDHLPSEIELCPIQLPGREDRLQEALYTDLVALIDALIPELQPHLDKPFAFFGHSMGGMIAFEVAQRLQKLDMPLPIRLFVSSWQAPQLVRADEKLRILSDGEFIEKLQQRYDAVPEVIRKNQDLQKLLLPILRADVAMLETHTYVPAPRLSCPITAFGGLNDRSVSRNELAAWQEQTSAAFDLQMFPGEHFYLNHVRSEIVETVIQISI